MNIFFLNSLSFCPYDSQRIKLIPFFLSIFQCRMRWIWEKYEHLYRHNILICFFFACSIHRLDDHLIICHQYQKDQFGCDSCAKRYSTRPSLLRHRAIVHGETRKYPCENCSKVSYQFCIIFIIYIPIYIYISKYIYVHLCGIRRNIKYQDESSISLVLLRIKLLSYSSALIQNLLLLVYIYTCVLLCV